MWRSTAPAAGKEPGRSMHAIQNKCVVRGPKFGHGEPKKLSSGYFRRKTQHLTNS